tara:strand:+ start:3185 stop:3523 length:339 start_codon:yes stop_codon:yes gene_type:complete
MKAKICYTVKEEEILPEASKFLMSLHVSIDSLKEDSYSNIAQINEAMLTEERKEDFVASIAMKIDIMRRNLIKIDEKMEDSYDILLGYINFLKKLREDKQEGEKDEQKHEEG